MCGEVQTEPPTARVGWPVDLLLKVQAHQVLLAGLQLRAQRYQVTNQRILYPKIPTFLFFFSDIQKGWKYIDFALLLQIRPNMP